MITIVVYRYLGVDATPLWGKICLIPSLTRL